MSRLVHRVAILLIAVVSGAPAVAVICAELCAPAAHHAAAGIEASSCHGRSDEGPAMTSQPAPDCGDHGMAAISGLTSLTASRGNDLAVLHPLESHTAVIVAIPAAGHTWTASEGSATPPRPTRSSPILRI